MSFEFPFEYVILPDIGKLFYPIVHIELQTKIGWQPFEFLVDTGADVTTLPLHLLPAIGINTSDLSVGQALGVGNISIKTLEFMLPIRIGSIQLQVRASAVESRYDSVPLLLGRKDIFEEKFNLLIDSHRKVTVISQNS